MPDTVRSPEEIRDLYHRIKTKKEREGKTYTQQDFCEDIGYVHKQAYRKITAPESEPHHRGISKSVNKLMDILEEKL